MPPCSCCRHIVERVAGHQHFSVVEGIVEGACTACIYPLISPAFSYALHAPRPHWHHVVPSDIGAIAAALDIEHPGTKRRVVDACVKLPNGASDVKAKAAADE